MVARLRQAHDVCDEHGDVATASLLETCIDETERRLWFLFETERRRFEWALGPPARGAATSSRWGESLPPT